MALVCLFVFLLDLLVVVTFPVNLRSVNVIKHGRNDTLIVNIALKKFQILQFYRIFAKYRASFKPTQAITLF